jgi:GxxExxY protein
MAPNVELLYKDEVYAIVGAAMEVHNSLGCGFLEPVYQEALEREVQSRHIPFLSQEVLPIYYKGILMKKTYIADLIAYGKIIVEIKAEAELTSRDDAQLLNYLKATSMEVGVLINFGAERLQWKRMINTKKSLSPITDTRGIR